jgi:hypothetical protein
MDDPDADFSVTDDSGLLSLTDCASYSSFLSEDWTYDGIVAHFQDQMRQGSIIVWDCGDGGGQYALRIRKGFTETKGFREVTAKIISTNGRLNIVSYDSLTMAAQFADEVLPSKQDGSYFISTAPGPYKVRVIQMYNPDSAEETQTPQFLIEIEPGEVPQVSGPAWLRTQ